MTREKSCFILSEKFEMKSKQVSDKITDGGGADVVGLKSSLPVGADPVSKSQPDYLWVMPRRGSSAGRAFFQKVTVQLYWRDPAAA